MRPEAGTCLAWSGSLLIGSLIGCMQRVMTRAHSTIEDRLRWPAFTLASTHTHDASHPRRCSRPITCPISLGRGAPAAGAPHLLRDAQAQPTLCTTTQFTASYQFCFPVSGSNFGMGWPVSGSNLAPVVGTATAG